MTWFSGIVVFVIIWWLVFFMILPIGVRSPEEAGVEVEPGHAPSAPVRPRIGLKAGATTLISVALWGIAYWIIEADLISFRAG
jgi:predicted secreted protein